MSAITHMGFAALAIPFLAGSVHAASYGVTNGDFSNGLTGWATLTAGGSVSHAGGAAVLETGSGFDDSGYSATLIQGDDGFFSFPNALLVPTDAATLRFDYQFIDLGVDGTESGTGVSTDALLVSILDKLDFSFDTAAFAEYILDPADQPILDVSFLAGREVAISFDLLDEDDGHNSRVIIDNVSFAAVPLPAALWLFLGALLPFVRLRRQTTAGIVHPGTTTEV